MNMVHFDLDRSAKMSVWSALGILGLLAYLWGLLLIMMTSQTDTQDDTESARTIWTCRVQSEEGFELMEKPIET